MGRTVVKLIAGNYVDEVKAIEGLIKKGQIRYVEVEAVVDIGATSVCLSREDIEKLGLKYHDIIDIKTADGKGSRRIFKGAEIELRGRSFVMEVMENDPGTPALIGYLLLEALDYVVDPKTQQIIPNPASEGGRWFADMCSIIILAH